MPGGPRAQRASGALRWLYRFSDLERGIGWNARSSPASLVLGMYRDKEARALLRPLLPLADRLWITQPRGARALASR